MSGATPKVSYDETNPAKKLKSQRYMRERTFAKKLAEIAKRQPFKAKNEENPIISKKKVICIRKNDKEEIVRNSYFNRMIGVKTLDEIREEINKERPLEDNESICIREEIKCFDGQRIIERHINVNDYETIKGPTDTFTDVQSDSPAKWDINFLFVRTMLQYPRKHRRAVYLDWLDMLTTKTLVSSRLFKSKEDLHVPNLYSKFRKNACAAFVDKVTIHHMSLHECIRDVLRGEYQWDIGMDYCCTFNGNDKIKPRDDIRLLFAHRLVPKHHGVLWFTFSTRRTLGGAEEIARQLGDLLRECMRENGYDDIECVETDTYGGMVYFIFVTKGSPETIRAIDEMEADAVDYGSQYSSDDSVGDTSDSESESVCESEKSNKNDDDYIDNGDESETSSESDEPSESEIESKD